MIAQRPVSFVLAASDHGPLIVNRLDYAHDPAGNIFGVGGQVFTKGSFDPEEVAAGLEILEERHEAHGDGVVALDVGANIGVFTLEWGREMVGWGEVIAFEPQDRLFFALAGNIALHNLYNVQPINAAVGRETGRLMIPKPNYLRAGSFGSLELKFRAGKVEYIGQPVSYEEDDLVPVVAVRIDDYQLPRVDFIKIDVEGMEVEAIEGARETIARCRPHLFVEWVKAGLPEVTAALQSLGYTLKVVGINLIGIPL